RSTLRRPADRSSSVRRSGSAIPVLLRIICIMYTCGREGCGKARGYPRRRGLCPVTAGLLPWLRPLIRGCGASAGGFRLLRRGRTVPCARGRSFSERPGKRSHEAVCGLRERGFAGVPVVEPRKRDRVAEVDGDGPPSEAAVPSGPDVVGSCDGARDDGHAGLEDQTDRPEPWGLEPSIPRAFGFDVDPNGLSLAESAECVPDALGVDLVPSHREGEEPRHEPGEKRRCELAALGHGVDGPRADGLDQDRVQDALVV